MVNREFAIWFLAIVFGVTSIITLVTFFAGFVAHSPEGEFIFRVVSPLFGVGIGVLIGSLWE